MVSKVAAWWYTFKNENKQVTLVVKSHLVEKCKSVYTNVHMGLYISLFKIAQI